MYSEEEEPREQRLDRAVEQCGRKGTHIDRWMAIEEKRDKEFALLAALF